MVEGPGGQSQEAKTFDIYTLLYMSKWIHKLLYSAGTSAQCYVAA